jgi:ribosomal protein S18 acetylase RimI-like enzyme
MSAMDPVISICIGSVALGETIAGGTAIRAVEIVSLAVMVAGIFGLAHSPAVRRTKEHGDVDQAGGEPAPAAAGPLGAAAPEEPVLAGPQVPPQKWGPFFSRTAPRPPVAVRPATGEDAADLSDLLARAWRATYTDLMPEATIEKVIDEYYSEPRIRRDVPPSADGRAWSGYLVAVDPVGRPLGAIAGGMTAPAVGEVFVLYADPDRRRQGAGRALLQALSVPQIELGATEQWLSVTRGNQLGIPFYLAQGFEVVEEVAPWDGTGADHGVRNLRMRRQLA